MRQEQFRGGAHDGNFDAINRGDAIFRYVSLLQDEHGRMAVALHVFFAGSLIGRAYVSKAFEYHYDQSSGYGMG